ncbi:hypothetical protein Prudu_004686 [Prunus dulcis]|uniref:Uncharacterized protein n=1 Tax=Prunus dulcis TaxID=3755 RepID=A0A4Y1QVX6_PRUDU|nr:hypothetical protein Prudu_004686 [Prunus dulcis]
MEIIPENSTMGVSSVQTLENWGFFQYQRIDQSFSHSISLATRSIEPIVKVMTQIVVEKAYVENFGAEQGMWRWILFGIGFVFRIPFGRWYLQKLRIVPFKQLLSSFCDDETMPATTSPLLSSFHSYDFLSHSHLDLYGWLSLNLSVAGLPNPLNMKLHCNQWYHDMKSPNLHDFYIFYMGKGLTLLGLLNFKLVFQLAAHPPFPASDKGWGKELGQVLLNP